ncbi:MAG: PTS transporter subunit EIIA [Planctomycetes bacterium]|jgi:fructose-specific phosphotransferase system IIA component|nr:PTS transporter subunit EIIA [Planctomycetota bacterium]
MRLTDILQPDCIKVPLASHDKQAAIFELADLLCEHTPIEDPDELKDAIWQREMTRTTGIGHGIAIPHGKCDGVDKLRMAIGVIGSGVEGIDFGSIDKKPVDLIILLASPTDQTGPHIQALAKISRMLTDAVIRRNLKDAPDAQTLYDLISQHEKVTV